MPGCLCVAGALLHFTKWRRARIRGDFATVEPTGHSMLNRVVKYQPSFDML